MPVRAVTSDTDETWSVSSSQKRPRLRAVIFDSFGTLFEKAADGAALKQDALRRAHAECDALVSLPAFTEFHAAYQRERDHDRAQAGEDAHREFDYEARMERAMRACGLGPRQARVAGARAAARYMRELGNAVRLMPDADGILNRVPDECRTAFASNFPSGPAIRAAMERLGVFYGFDHVAVSGEVGWRKPHPALFTECLEALGVDASEAVMVGDHPDHDCAPAKAMGMRTILVANPRGTLPPRRVPDADYVLGTLAELPPLLAKL